MEPEKVYSTKELIENLNNALENGYEELGETDIGDLLLMCVRPTRRAADRAYCDCDDTRVSEFDDACELCGLPKSPRR